MQDLHSTLQFDAVHVSPFSAVSFGPGAGPTTSHATGGVSPDLSASVSKRTKVAFAVCGRVRQLALISIASVGLWPQILQLILVPESVFGDGHGDRYEQMSYYAQENDHYQVFSPRAIECEELQTHLFAGQTPVPARDLVRAIPEALYKSLRAKVVQNTSDDSPTARNLSVLNEIVGLAHDKSVCYGGIDSVGSFAIEALISRSDAPAFGLDPACIQDTATHLRMRLMPSEFFDPDTMSELNPVRIPGAVAVVSLVDARLKPVLSSCYEMTRMTRFHASPDEYKRLLAVFSRRLLVAEDCTLAVGVDGREGVDVRRVRATPQFREPEGLRSHGRPHVQRAPVHQLADPRSRAHSIRHELAGLASHPVVSPWNNVVHASTSCTIAKVVRSSYNLVLVAQMALGLLTWRRQLTIDMLVGAETRQAVLRATGCGTLMAVLGVNVFFARGGDMKRQEIEPSFAHVIAFAASLVLHSITHMPAFESKARKLLLHGLRTVTPEAISHHSACRGSIVCAAQASLRDYSLLLVCVVVTASLIGILAHTLLEASVRRKRSVVPSVSSAHTPSRTESLNSFNRFLDDRSRDTDLFDVSVCVYVQAPDGTVLSTRGHLEVCGFVPTTTMLLRYRDLPLLFAAHVLPVWILKQFNINVTIHDLRDAGVALTAHRSCMLPTRSNWAHWSALKKARLSWSDAYFGGREFNPDHKNLPQTTNSSTPQSGTEFQRRCRCNAMTE